MIVLETQPNLTDLHQLIGRVPSYPISVGQLLTLARVTGAKPEVIEFYRSFPSDEIFFDANDLYTRTEQIEMMDRESQPEEDEVRGAED